MSEDELRQLRQVIADAIAQHDEDLLAAARIFASRFELPSPDETAADVAEDLFQATVVRAFDIADRFDSRRLPRPWLTALLLNVAKEERRRRYRDRRHTSSLRAVGRKHDPDAGDGLSEDELLERLRQAHDETDPDSDVHLEELLDLVSDTDREVLRLFVVEELSGQEAGIRLGITAGAAHVRLHRALGRLRTAYAQWDESTKRVRCDEQ